MIKPLYLFVALAAMFTLSSLALACGNCGCAVTTEAIQASSLAMAPASKPVPASKPATQPAATQPQKPHAHGDHAHPHAHDHAHPHPHTHHHSDDASPLAGLHHLTAVMMPTEGNTAHGTIHFKTTKKGVHITGTFTGLSANAHHAIHIHEFGDLTANDGTATGGHYNPEGHDHGLLDQEHRHAGDLGNLKTDADGNATIDLHVSNITLAHMNNPIIGRGVIIHAKKDDGGQPTGNAGARIAQGVIGIAKH